MPDRPLIIPKYEQTLCPWTPENTRHDHQLIFPLSNNRLLHVWSEYYANRPSDPFRNQYDTERGTKDEFPCQLSGKISTDQGRTWSAKFTLQENIWGKNVKHPNMIRLKNNDILFTFTAWESDEYRNVYMKRSSDECETWSDIVQLSQPGWYCTNNDHILRLSSGRILLPSHGGPGFKYVRGDLHSFVFYSDDEFETWHLSQNTMTAPGRGAHEPTIIERKDGRLLCLLRTTQKCIYKSYSDDQGTTWTTPEPIHLPAPDSPPLVTRMPTGDLLLLWNCVASDRNWPRTPLTAALSKDDGETWHIVGDIDNRSDHDAAYAAVYYHNNEALITYYTRGTDWARDSEIMLKIYDINAFYQ
jgi:sialidase-1